MALRGSIRSEGRAREPSLVTLRGPALPQTGTCPNLSNATSPHGRLKDQADRVPCSTSAEAAAAVRSKLVVAALPATVELGAAPLCSWARGWGGCRCAGASSQYSVAPCSPSRPPERSSPQQWRDPK